VGLSGDTFDTHDVPADIGDIVGKAHLGVVPRSATCGRRRGVSFHRAHLTGSHDNVIVAGGAAPVDPTTTLRRWAALSLRRIEPDPNGQPSSHHQSAGRPSP
jgi:hypothetical protein